MTVISGSDERCLNEMDEVMLQCVKCVNNDKYSVTLYLCGVVSCLWLRFLNTD